MIDLIEKNLLKEIADLHGIPEGAYNIRINGKSEGSLPILPLRASPTERALIFMSSPEQCTRACIFR